MPRIKGNNCSSNLQDSEDYIFRNANWLHAFLFQFSCTELPAFFVVNTLQGILRNSAYPLDGTLVELFLAVNKERHCQPLTALNGNNETEEVIVTSPTGI